MYYSAFDLIFKSKDLLLPELKKIELINGNYDVLIQKDNHKNWPSIENYSNELMKLMDDDEKYKAHLSQMSFVTGTIADTKFKYVGSGIRNLVRSVVFFIIFFILVYI